MSKERLPPPGEKAYVSEVAWVRSPPSMQKPTQADLSAASQSAQAVMDRDHDAAWACASDAVRNPIPVALAADRQYIDAAQARIHELEQEVQTLCVRLERLIRANRSMQQRLKEAVPDDIELDLRQVYKTRHDAGYVKAPESVVIEATNRLRARYDVEFAELLEAEYRLQMEDENRP